MRGRTTAITILVGLGLLFSGPALADTPVGLVSYIGDEGDVELAGADPRMAAPHVEVIDISQLDSCREKMDCRFEYYVPYITDEAAKKLEHDLSLAWARFVTRTAWHVHAMLYGKALGCGNKQDKYYGAWDGSAKTLEEDEFCDGNIPETPVPWFPMACPSFYIDWQEFGQRYAEGIAYALAHYYPDYITDVTQAIGTHAPLALMWQDPISGEGSALIAVSSLKPSVLWTELATKSQDPRAVPYFEQSLPGMPHLRETLKKINPQLGVQSTTLGIKALEEVKKKLMSRSDIFKADKYWAGYNGGPKPDGEIKAGLPSEYQILGLVPFMRLYGKFDTELAPQKPIFWVACVNAGAVPPLIPIPIPAPVVVVGWRTHTAWDVVPEGYPIPGIKGDPVY